MNEDDQESLSLWQSKKPLLSFPILAKNTETDICIIGAGISGLTTAYILSSLGKSVVLIDDGPIAGGQTVRTTGHLTNVLDDRYFLLEDYFGIEGAKFASESHREAINFIENLVKQHSIDCDFETVNAYLFVPPGESLDVLKKELGAAHRAGLIDATMINRAPLSTFDTGPCLCFPKQAQFDVIPYLNSLCALIQKREVQIFSYTHASQIKKTKDSYVVITDHNHSIKAKHVVLATNTPFNSRFFPHLKQAAYRTYVITWEIPKNSVEKAIFYDTANPYHYIRIANHNKEHDLLIIGGEDHRTGEKADTESCYENLKKWTTQRFPMAEKVCYQWSGQVMEPVDCLAFIGKVSDDSELYMITGDSGNGLTHGTLGAMLISDLILKRSNPWEKLYSPHRITLKATHDFVDENVNTAWQYREWMTKGDIESVSELKPNCAGILRKGLKKHACYRDKEGQLHEFSATCPHLGAIVNWNASEHCWECPAHGSRFDPYGKLLQGPANCNLKPCK